MSRSDLNQRLAFHADWFQEEASIIRKFTICFFVGDNSVEVFDQRSKRIFMRRTKIPDLSSRDFYVGSQVSIYGRQFTIVDYADEFTRNTLAKYRKQSFLLLKSSVLDELGTVLCALIDSGFSISKGLMVKFTAEHVKLFLGEKSKGDVETSVLLNSLLAGPSMGFEVVADNAVDILRACHAQSEECKQGNMPPALVSLFEREELRTGIYCAANEETALKNINFFFESKLNLQVTLELQNSTLAVIKPHCIKEGNLGKIIKEISNNGFKFTAMRMHLLERLNCEEFYEVYRGILPEYVPLVAQLASGVCMALEVVCTDPSKDTYKEFREFCGPMDPQIARLLRPHTLRAKFGVSKACNAVHCTDLSTDTVLELQYFFKILG